jgi:DinB superfamily
MNVLDVLKYGHQTLLASVEGLPDADWEAPGAAGAASVKDLFAHLASMEQVLGEVLQGFLGGGPTPYLDAMREQGDRFNDDQIASRRGVLAREVLAEYDAAYARAMALAAQIPAETFRGAGALPWYGAAYDLEDFIVYTYYGHKREHSAQIGGLRDRLGR